MRLSDDGGRDGLLDETKSAVSQRNRPKKTVPIGALLLAAVCAVGLFRGTAAQGEWSRALPARAPRRLELPFKRTTTSDTFELPGGQRETRIYNEPVNYRSSDGSFKPIVEGFEASARGAIRDRGHKFSLSLPSRLGAGPTRFADGQNHIAFELADAESKPVELESDGGASYDLPKSQTAFKYATLPDGVKETIELAGPSAPNIINYKLYVARGLKPELTTKGSVDFRRHDGSVAAIMPAPTVTDPNSTAPVSGPASFALSSRGITGVWNLTLKVERSWLSDAGRAWPVLIDPTLVEGEPSLEVCNLTQESLAVSETYCQWPNFWAMHQSGTTYYQEPEETKRALLSVNLQSLPAGAEIHEMSVNLYSPAAALNTHGLELNRVTTSWGPKVEWICASKGAENHCNQWLKPGGDFTNEGSQVLVAERGSQAGYWSFSNGLAAIAQAWTTGVYPNQGLILKQDDESNVCTPKCIKREVEFEGPNIFGEPAKHPNYVRVLYVPKAPYSSRIVSPTEGTRTARRLKLRAAWKSAGVEGITYEYREGKSGPFQTVPAELVKTIEGKAVTWPVPVAFEQRESQSLYLDAAHLSTALRKKGGVVQVRAVFAGPREVAGFSAPVETVVNRLVGSPADATAPVGPGAVDLLTGNFSISHSDVSIPTYNSSLGFSRSFTDRRAPANAAGDEAEKQSAEELTSPLGPGWAPGVPLEEAGGIVWKNLKIVEENGSFEEFEYSFAYALLTTVGGGQIGFEKNEDGTYSVPPEVTGWSLVAEEGGLVLTDPSGTRTKFTDPGGGPEYVPTSILESAGGAATKTEVEYEVPKVGVKRLHMIVAPPPPGLSCTTQTEATGNAGCRALIFNYASATGWGAPAEDGERLASIFFYAPGSSEPKEVAKYEYNAQGRLIGEWDPRLPTPLKETYAYNSEGELQTIKPPGEEAWTLEYGTYDEEEGPGRLTAVKRPTLLASPTTAQTSIAYEVPVSGAGAPYEMGGTSVSQWSQKDLPVTATAIFPPDQVPTAKPPTSYSHATVSYLDSAGHVVNTAAPSPSGSGAAISTSEENEFGDVVRELTARNRNTVMAESEANRTEKAAQLETRRKFNSAGTQMEEEIGPLHTVRLESGVSAQGRLHRVVQYDHRPEGVPLPFPDPNLPTRETTGAWVEGVLRDERVTETEYDWKLRRPTKVITVMGSEKPNIEKSTAYNDITGLPTEKRQPSNAKAAGAATMKMVYYGAGAGSGCETTVYYGLLCRTEPVSQPSVPEGLPSQPKLLVKRFLLYNSMDEPTEVSESPGGEAGNVRKTTSAYDQIGRPVTTKVEGGGTAVPKTETVYSSTTGAATKQQFACEGCSTKATTITRNTLGQVTEYEDADGNKTKYTYDVDGRPTTVSDAKGTQTFSYAEASGALTKLEDSGVGTFTAAYDADGDLVERVLPDGLTARTIYNQVDQPTGLTYTKASSCGESCTWYRETLERSIYGQVMAIDGSLVGDHYAYDHAGRLTEAQETPSGGQCITRAYEYDADSNRLSRATRPGVGSTCTTSGGTTQSYRYDAADRLDATGMTYDAWGRITSLPAELAGGKTLTTSYFADDMVASQSQNGVTNTYELDGSLRQRQRVQAGGVSGTEVFHYDNPGDSPAWTSLGSTWTRYVSGIGGELAAIQESSGTTTFDLVDLHGDVVAKASSSPTATKLLATYRFDEFGEPVSGSAGRFGWLGGKVRRTELPSGVIQMGARSYVPQIGRFLSTDPVAGGSANAYDYGNQDPVDEVDIAGTKPYAYGEEGTCAAQLHVYSPEDSIPPDPSIGDNTYGKFYARYKLVCGAFFFNTAVVKIIRTFELEGGGPIYPPKESLPHNLSGSHFEFGNWTQKGLHGFTCLQGQEYVYRIEFLVEWHAYLPVVDDEGSGPGEGGQGSLPLEAEQVCEGGS